MDVGRQGMPEMGNLEIRAREMGFPRKEGWIAEGISLGLLARGECVKITHA